MVAKRFWLFLIPLTLALKAGAGAEIPQTAKQDPRFALGYLVATTYPGVASDGTGDSTAGLQQAIEDGIEHNLSVLLPAGEYIITKSLKCYKWQLWQAGSEEGDAKAGTENPDRSNHILLGTVEGGKRPLIRLAKDAPGFDNPEEPRPMLAFRNFRGLDKTAVKPLEPENAAKEPEGFSDATPNLFGEMLCDIDFDCGKHPGAIGVNFAAAQSSGLFNCRVNAEGAYAGFKGLPGRNSVAGNIEVEGGRIGLLLDGHMAGAVVVGARLHNQTEMAISFVDFSPLMMVGFEIVKDNAPAIELKKSDSTAVGSMCLVDGRIDLKNGGCAIDNRVGKTLYLRNIFINGAQSLIQSADQKPIEAKAGWNRIAEYACSDLNPLKDDPPYEVDDRFFRVFSIIDGKKSQDPEPIVNVDMAEPPADLIQRHLWDSLPLYLGQNDQTIVATAAEYGATPDDDSDDAGAIQKAIDAAANAGHGRVFLPAGDYLIGKTLELKANTVLTGAGWRKSRILCHEDWMPAEGKIEPMLQTIDEAEATTQLAFLTLYAPGPSRNAKLDPKGWQPGLPIDPRLCFTELNWRAGRNSMTIAVELTRETGATSQRISLGSAMEFTGNGGGRHYVIHPRPPAAHPDHRPILINGTSQALAIYGLNSEGSQTKNVKGAMQWAKGAMAATNTEIRNARNVRIYGTKREGWSPTLIVRDSDNVALYTSGGMRGATFPGLGGYVQFYGNTNNVLAAALICQAAKSIDEIENMNPEPMLREQLSDNELVEVEWPESVSIYKRGDLDEKPFERGQAESEGQ